jgi:C-5 cytosine-specific DNA methylase
MPHVEARTQPDGPLAIDLFCGLGGWTEGLLAEGYRMIGFDNERHIYGEARYPAQLVLQDVLTLHGRQFKDAALIVASPPCQEFSYMAMPWTRAKEKAKALREGRDDPKRLTALFDACFRIQREACEAAGRHIPLVVENVCGAQKWVGRARWHFGSFYLWGDVPALMPITRRSLFKDGTAKVGGFSWDQYGKPGYKAQAFNGQAEQRFRATKNDGGSWFNIAHNTTSGHGQNPVHEGVKQRGSGAIWFDSGLCRQGSKSSARKAASAHIAKIPIVLSRHIARAWKPQEAA